MITKKTPQQRPCTLRTKKNKTLEAADPAMIPLFSPVERDQKLHGENSEGRGIIRGIKQDRHKESSAAFVAANLTPLGGSLYQLGRQSTIDIGYCI